MADASASIVAALRETSDLLRSTDSLTDIDTHTLDHEGGGSDAFSRKASTEEIAISSQRIKCSSKLLDCGTDPKREREIGFLGPTATSYLRKLLNTLWEGHIYHVLLKLEATKSCNE